MAGARPPEADQPMAEATDPVPTDLSRSVAELGFEPRISSFKGRRPTTRRLGKIKN